MKQPTYLKIKLEKVRDHYGDKGKLMAVVEFIENGRDHYPFEIVKCPKGFKEGDELIIKREAREYTKWGERWNKKE